MSSNKCRPNTAIKEQLDWRVTEGSLKGCLNVSVVFCSGWRGEKTHHYTAALCCCRSSEWTGDHCRRSETRAPAASPPRPDPRCTLCEVPRLQQDWAGGRGLYWNLEWHQCCGRVPQPQCPHSSPVHGSCLARGSCRPPCSWYPVINAFRRPGTVLQDRGRCQGKMPQKWYTEVTYDLIPPVTPPLCFG